MMWLNVVGRWAGARGALRPPQTPADKCTSSALVKGLGTEMLTSTRSLEGDEAGGERGRGRGGMKKNGDDE